jgi:hypothetical protein
MANALFNKFKQSLLSQSPAVDVDTDTIKILLIEDTYVFDATDQFVSDLPGASIVQRSNALTGKSVTDGVFNSDPTTLGTVPTGHSCHVIQYDDTPATDAAKPLMGFYDTGTNIPIVTNGGDVQVSPDSGANKWFKL